MYGIKVGYIYFCREDITCDFQFTLYIYGISKFHPTEMYVLVKVFCMNPKQKKKNKLQLCDQRTNNF